MSDIVERLRRERHRQETLPSEMCGLGADDCEEAADEIERLQAKILGLWHELETAIEDSPCRFGGGNDYMACDVCGIEFDYRKGPPPPCGAKTRITALRAEVKRLRTGLRIIAGYEQCIDNLMSDVEVARATLGKEG